MNDAPPRKQNLLLFRYNDLAHRGRILSACDFLPTADFVVAVVAAYVSSIVESLLPPSVATLPIANAWIDRNNLALIGASLGAFVCYDQRFAMLIARGAYLSLLMSYLVRTTATIAGVVVIGFSTHLFESVSSLWLICWTTMSVSFTFALRLVIARWLRTERRTQDSIALSIEPSRGLWKYSRRTS